MKYLSWLHNSDEVKALVAEHKREVNLYRNSTILASVVMIATIILMRKESK